MISKSKMQYRILSKLTHVEKNVRLILTFEIRFESFNQIIKIIVFYCFKLTTFRQKQILNN